MPPKKYVIQNNRKRKIEEEQKQKKTIWKKNIDWELRICKIELHLRTCVKNWQIVECEKKLIMKLERNNLQKKKERIKMTGRRRTSPARFYQTIYNFKILCIIIKISFVKQSYIHVYKSVFSIKLKWWCSF